MMLKFWIRAGAGAIAIALGVGVCVAWRNERRDQAQLKEQLDVAQKALKAAGERQEARDKELATTLGSLQKKKAEVKTPEQVVQALPEVLALPEPIAIKVASSVPGTGTAGGAERPEAPSPKVVMPVDDLKPLYDAAVECKECRVELVAAEGDLADEKAKTETLSRELGDALRAVKGGSILRRVARAAKWFAIGAAAGAIAAKAAH